jgi:hypothetical protein
VLLSYKPVAKRTRASGQSKGVTSAAAGCGEGDQAMKEEDDMSSETDASIGQPGYIALVASHEQPFTQACERERGDRRAQVHALL